jgi:pyruvate kinase
MALVWGVEAVDVALPTTTDEIVDHAMRAFTAAKRLKTGDSVVLSAGVPAGEPGNTNLILIRPVTTSHEG